MEYPENWEMVHFDYFYTSVVHPHVFCPPGDGHIAVKFANAGRPGPSGKPKVRFRGAKNFEVGEMIIPRIFQGNKEFFDGILHI